MSNECQIWVQYTPWLNCCYWEGYDIFSQSVETLRIIYIACLLWYCEWKQYIFKIHFKLKVFVRDCFKIEKITFFQIQN